MTEKEKEKTIAEQFKENKDKALTIAGFIFEQFPYIESIGICLGSDGKANAVANITRKNGLKAVGDYPLPWETED